MDIDKTSSYSQSYRVSNSLVADKVVNIFYAQRYNGSTKHILKFNTNGTWIKIIKSRFLFYVDKIATNDEDVILITRSEWFVDELDNELVNQQRCQFFQFATFDRNGFFFC